ncbi:MAG: hypothetical protein IID46_15210 [Planctomycetes bacterium]|nr:hypothetical protein [Planctomycetota bacterium]
MNTPLATSMFVRRVGLLAVCFSLLVVSGLPATEKPTSPEKDNSSVETEATKKKPTKRRPEKGSSAFSARSSRFLRRSPFAPQAVVSPQRRLTPRTAFA